MYLNESICSAKYSLLKPLTLSTFDISITLDRHNLNFDVGELLYSWSESTGFRVTQSGLLQSFDTDS
jgi:hypothetical protein